MPDVFVEVEGLELVLNRMGRFHRVIAAEMKRGLVDAAAVVAAEAKNVVLNSTPTGSLRPDGSRASAPGQPPASLTGELVKSIGSGPGKGLTAMVIVRQPGAVSLEYGRRGAEPRPFVRPAVDATRGVLVAILNRAAARGLEKLIRSR